MTQEQFVLRKAPEKWKRKLGFYILCLLTLLALLIYALSPSLGAFKEGILVTPSLSGDTRKSIGPKGSHWTPKESISKNFFHAVIVAEDVNFYSHSGIDLAQIIEAAQLNLKESRYVRGASTITQQVIKIATLSSEKTLLRKLREAIGAIRLERMIGKNEILAWYANLAYFGSGIYGIKDAAQYYFGTTPDRLTISESVHLALILPAPSVWSESLKNKILTEFGRKRFTQLVTEMRNNRYITPVQYQASLSTGNFGRPVTSIMEHH